VIVALAEEATTAPVVELRDDCSTEEDGEEEDVLEIEFSEEMGNVDVVVDD